MPKQTKKPHKNQKEKSEVKLLDPPGRFSNYEPKNYEDLLKYAKQFTNISDAEKNYESLTSFPKNLKISAEDAIKPYYGDQFDLQKASVQEYAKQLNEQKPDSVKIDPAFYASLSRQIPVINASVVPHYNVTEDQLFFPNPLTAADQITDLTQDELNRNNYGTKEDYVNYLNKKGLFADYMDTVEHEILHASDRQVSFPSKTSSLKTDLGYGYMGRDNHLVTGLSKVQREQYSMQGSRFESPESFKEFLFNLAASKNPEEEISGFSEEAKRALRPQIENARYIYKYQQELDAWRKDKRFFLKPPAPQPPSILRMDFLEKSANLIPALVQVNNNNENIT